MPRYKVEPNYCNCHPETCACDPWAITDAVDGAKYDTVFSKVKAESMVQALNLRDERNTLTSQVAELEEALRPFVQKIDIVTVLKLPPITRVAPKLLTAGDYQQAAKALKLNITDASPAQ